jgi:hypothetical protein
VIAIHVRRGDVTYLDKYGRPSSRWVQTHDMLEVLRGVGQALGAPLEPPRVLVHLFSEARGWFANDTAALREVAPRASVHLDSSPSATIDALTMMSRADILLMGTSGFSTWAGIFSCGVKIGPAHRPMLPMRHIPYSNSLVARSGEFARVALPAFRVAWARYWECKREPRCLPTLCAVRHISDERWVTSPLAMEYARRPLAAQWHVPSEPPLASTRDEAVPAGNGGDGRSRRIEGWAASQQECLSLHPMTSQASLLQCTRSRWQRHVGLALSLKQRQQYVAKAAATANASSADVRGGSASQHQGGARASMDNGRARSDNAQTAGGRAGQLAGATADANGASSPSHRQRASERAASQRQRLAGSLPATTNQRTATSTTLEQRAGLNYVVWA